MEPSASAQGTETDERNRRAPLWKGLPLGKGVPFAVAGTALILLLLAKILFSGLFLRSELPPAVVGLAHAGDPKQSRSPAPAASRGGVERMSVEALKERELALRAKELELKKKEEELLPLKRDIDEKLGELNELQSRLTAYAKSLADREEALKDTRMAHLVELYTAMEPARAALIMEKLKIETVVQILRHMKGKAAGQIIALLKPEFGAQVVEKLSHTD